MYKGKSVLAYIPARGNSKGIPKKNIVSLGAKPLIRYTIEAAKGCPYIDEIVVSTDSEEISEVSKKYGASVPFLRPEALATDTSATIDGVMYTLEHLQQHYDVLVLLQPTSPLRTSQDITEALETYFNEECKGLVSISEAEELPVLMRTIVDGRMEHLLHENSTVRRQDAKKTYRVNGAIYINDISSLSRSTSFNDNEGFYLMERSHSVDIDEPKDLIIAEYYLQNPLS